MHSSNVIVKTFLKNSKPTLRLQLECTWVSKPIVQISWKYTRDLLTDKQTNNNDNSITLPPLVTGVSRSCVMRFNRSVADNRAESNRFPRRATDRCRQLD